MCNYIVNQYPDWTTLKLDSDEMSYLESLVCDIDDSNNEEDESMERPSDKFKELWCGKVTNYNDNCVARFVITPDDQTPSKIKSLQKRFATAYSKCRSAFVCRVYNTLDSFVKSNSKVIGLDAHDDNTKLSALREILTHGLDRLRDSFVIVKPFFQSFALQREKKAMSDNGSGCNLRKVSLKEFKSVNGKNSMICYIQQM